MNTEPGYSPFSPVPNSAVEGSKVPSIYNKIMDRLTKEKNVSIQPRVRIFNLSVREDRQDYEELMHSIHSKGDRYIYVGSKDHWDKEGDFLRAVDYVEFFQLTTEKEWRELSIEKGATSVESLKDVKEDLRKELAIKTEDLSKELSFFDKKPEEIKKEIEEDDIKLEEAIEELEIPVEVHVMVNNEEPEEEIEADGVEFEIQD